MTDADLDPIIEKILIREGGWSDRKNDRGGPTQRGMTLEQWKIYCEDAGQPERATKAGLKASTQQDAFLFYRWYIRRSGALDDWYRGGVLPQIIDMAVHHRLWRRIVEDACLLGDSGDEERLGMARIRYMAELVQNDPKQKEFFYGWVLRALEAAGWWPRETPTKEV